MGYLVRFLKHPLFEDFPCSLSLRVIRSFVSLRYCLFHYFWIACCWRRKKSISIEVSNHEENKNF
ncbi:unnamed protein product [Bathycoccus prasinos]